MDIDYQQQQLQGQPLLFIDVKEQIVDDRKQYLFELTPQAIQLLQQIKDLQVAILVIAGPQRSGKSYLSNRILKQQKGFEIGPSTNPCTKGIWIWSKPVHLDEKTVMLLLDTEGLNSVQKDATYDTKVFSISVLFSSMMIYNNLGHIDETALENLSLVVKLSENICVSKLGEDDQKLAEYFPYFYWVLRDFSLDLKGKSPKQYLEQTLQPVPGDSPQILKKNQIREKLRIFFQNRDCECLVRPLNEESKLQRIENQEWSSLRQQFRDGIESFEKKVFQNIQPKKIGNKILTGEMFMKLALEYLDAINTGGVPTILNSMERMISSEIRRIYEEVIRVEYNKILQSQVQTEQMPYEDEDLLNKFKEINAYMLDFLDKKVKNIADSDKLIELRREITDLIEKDMHIKRNFNRDISKSKCATLLNKFLNSFQLPLFTSLEQIKPSTIKEKQEEFMIIFKQYLQQAKGQFKYRSFCEKFPQYIFEFFDKYNDRIQRIYEDELNRAKVIMAACKDAEERLRASLREYDNLTNDLAKEKEQKTRELENVRKEYEKYRSLKEKENENARLRIQELEKQIEKKENENIKLKNDFSENFDEKKKYIRETNSKRQDIEHLQKKIDELLSLQNETTLKSPEENTTELYVLLKDLKLQILQMEDYIKKKKQNNSYSAYLDEIDSMKNEKYQQIQKFHQDYKIKKDEFKKQFERDLLVKDKKIEILNQFIDELKSKNMDLQKKNESSEKKDQQIQNLQNENEKVSQAHLHKNSNLETHSIVLQQFTKDIEKMTAQKMELEQKLAIVQAERSNLNSLKETYPYVLKESLKWVLNKKCSLQHSLKGLNQDDIATVKEIFESLNLPLSF